MIIFTKSSKVRTCLYVCTYLGASAGIFALSTAHIASMILNYNEDIAVQRTRWRNKIKFPTVRAFGRGIR